VAPPVFEDLAARICELEIELPPLCERRSDLPLMIQHAVELTAARRGHTTAPRIAEATIEWLLEYDWPGNAHELLETIELAMDRVLPPTSANPSTTEIFEIKVEHFPERIRWAIKHGRLERPAAVEIDLESRLASIEKEFIERALHQAKANKTKAAQSLKISRGKFLRRCEQLGVQFPDVPIDFQFADDPIDFREDES
jgi:DNA-binding NtrC family response regulator